MNRLFIFLDRENIVYWILNVPRQFTKIRNNFFRKSRELNILQIPHPILHIPPIPAKPNLFPLSAKRTFFVSI